MSSSKPANMKSGGIDTGGREDPKIRREIYEAQLEAAELSEDDGSLLREILAYHLLITDAKLPDEKLIEIDPYLPPNTIRISAALAREQLVRLVMLANTIPELARLGVIKNLSLTYRAG